ncbi:DinI-like family protein [Enterobacter cloacae]
MFVELFYDKRNVEGLEGAREIILAELTKRVHQIFPNAEVKVKPMQANSLNIHRRSALSLVTHPPEIFYKACTRPHHKLLPPAFCPRRWQSVGPPGPIVPG